MGRIHSAIAIAGVLVTGLGLGLAAQQKPAAPAAGGASAKPSVTVYKSPT